MTVKLALEASVVARADVQALAARSGWQHEQTFGADAQNGFEIFWSVPGHTAEVHYVEDAIVGQAYLALTGAQADAMAASIRAALPCVGLAEVLQRLHRTNSEEGQIVLARALAVLGPDEYVNDVMHTLADLLQSTHARVRVQALLAIASLGWPILRPLATAVADSDEDAEIRQRASDVLRAFDAAQRGGAY